jgi:hypothetical protein
MPSGVIRAPPPTAALQWLFPGGGSRRVELAGEPCASSILIVPSSPPLCRHTRMYSDPFVKLAHAYSAALALCQFGKPVLDRTNAEH